MERKELVYQHQNILGNDVEMKDYISNEEEAPQVKECVILPCLDENVTECVECCLPRNSKYSAINNNTIFNICDDKCLNSFKKKRENKVAFGSKSNLRVKNLRARAGNDSMVANIKCKRNCGECSKNIADMETNLFWEIMEFCNQQCLGKYQKRKYSNCTSCKAEVNFTCLGKYCVRFGNIMRQFCGNKCLHEFKKNLRVCSYCLKDVSDGDDGVLAPVGEQGFYKDFCNDFCMRKYAIMYGKKSPHKNGVCVVCNNENDIAIEFELDNKKQLFCGNPCFAAFKFANDIVTGKCGMCQKYCNTKELEDNSMFYENADHFFCSESCKSIYFMVSRKIVSCKQCKANKYNFDMVKCRIGNGRELILCSLNCLNLYQELSTGASSIRLKCCYCLKKLQPTYHNMVDATVRTFCSYNCIIGYQNQYSTTFTTLNESNQPYTIVQVKLPVEAKPESSVRMVSDPLAVSNMQYSASTSQIKQTTKTRKITEIQSMVHNSPSQNRIEYFKPLHAPKQRNVATMCTVIGNDKSVNCKPATADKEVQADKLQEKLAILPIPMPVYVPLPMCTYSLPLPVPFPFPLPIPVPIFIPTTCNTASEIMEKIQNIKENIPADPFEAELIIMAEMAANSVQAKDLKEMKDKDKSVDKLSNPEDDGLPKELGADTLCLGASEDLENVLIPSTLRSSKEETQGTIDDHHPVPQTMKMQNSRGSKRSGDSPNGSKKKQKRNTVKEMEVSATTSQQPPQNEPDEKADAEESLMYTLGINVWNNWIVRRNAQLEKSSPPIKLLKSEILQFTRDELNSALCLFVKEVRKPNGLDYSPDTIYYLCLCIQMYLYINERTDNIFYDIYYEKFTECLDEIANKFLLLYKDMDYIVTRVREEHLWESKQLGAHSPYVLLNTIMFFNTKYFKLETLDDHKQLYFLKAMKHWRGKFRQSGESKIAEQKLSDLHFDKKSYQECPKQLYEFYLSKCPESAKTRSDVFYLQPERYCSSDSPVWFSAVPLSQNNLRKMLHRIKMVKEINVALLHN